MTTVLTREPLQTLSMASVQRTSQRRSARQAFEEEDGSRTATKRSRMEGGEAPMTSGKSVGSRANGASRKLKTSYDEDDHGFQFTRTRAKRTQQSANPEPEPPQQQETPPGEDPVAQKPARRKFSFSTPIVKKKRQETAPTRRSARLSAERVEAAEHEAVLEPEKARRKKRPSKERRLEPEPVEPASAAEEPQTVKRDATKIALPFADTPVIKRNKEMRKGSGQNYRRSSTGTRGRRASSLIESGTSNAVPHADVEIAEFYKLIDQNILEPRRMLQLLTWCGARALPEKPTGNGDANVVMPFEAARHIQEELLKEFANNYEISDWFNREDVPSQEPVKKPNPRNAQMLERLQELEQEIESLQAEKKSWETLPSVLPPIPTFDSSTSTPPSPINPSFLDDPEQSAIVESLLRPPPLLPSTATDHAPLSTKAALESHLQPLITSLEPSIDALADGVHRIEQYRLAAERAADRVLGTAADFLEDRDRRGREKVGGQEDVGGVLGALAGIMAQRGAG